MLNENNSPDVITEAVDEASYVRKMVWIWCVGCELFDQVHETIDIVLDRGRLLDVEVLAKEQFMLIAAKALTNQTTEGWPIEAD